MLEDVSQLCPLPFFSTSMDVLYLPQAKEHKRWEKKYLLPNLNDYLDEEKFANVSLFWNEKGIGIGIEAKTSIEKINQQDFRRGDSIEIFVDTRDIKNQYYVSKYCHHFVFFPDEPLSGKEVTRFYQEEKHPLCHPQDLQIRGKVLPKKYIMEIMLYQNCLYGFDTGRFDRFGFTYRINRYLKEAQNFSFSSKEFP